MYVLIVEDQNYLSDYIRAVLKLRGVEARSVLSAEEAHLAIAEDVPHLILTDLNLPGESGLEFVRRLKSDPALSTVPVIAVTADDRQWRSQQLREAGCAEFLVKPIMPDQLFALVARYLPTP